MELRDEAPPVEDVGGEEMRAPEEVAVMLRLHALGCSRSAAATGDYTEATGSCTARATSRRLRKSWSGRTHPRAGFYTPTSAA